MKKLAFLFTLAGCLAVACPVDAALLQRWRFDRAQNRLEFTTDQRTQPRAVLLSNPTRLVIDLPGIFFRQPRQNQLLGNGFRSLRIAQFDRQTTRMVIELEPGYTIDPTQIRFRGITANQWTVQLPTPIPPSATPLPLVTELPLPVPPPERGTVAPIPGLATPVELPTPTAPLPRVNNEQIIVVIDPGHGGPDPGAIGIGGLREVDVLMPISQQVAGLLRQQGVRVVMTRETDKDLGLQPRTQLANRMNATIFVSIHANAISLNRPDVNGAETYYYNQGSQPLAASIQRNIIAATGLRDRGVKRSRFYVLRNTRMPSALVEVGFVTGAEDAPKLADPEFRSRMAVAIARGILEHLQANPPRLPVNRNRPLQ